MSNAFVTIIKESVMTRKWIVWTGVMALAIGAAVWAQQGGDARPADRAAQGDGRGGFDPAQMRQRMMESIKEQLKASDEEWKALEPKVERVATAQRNVRAGGGMMGMGGRRGGMMGAGDQPQSETAKAAAALRTTLQNASATDDEIKAGVAALREARKQAQAELDAARKELAAGLTPRKEAVLVSAGLLE